jgi:uncharacterized protein
MIGRYEVIDFHGHHGPSDFYGMRDGPAHLLRVMDAAGIDRACLFNIFHPAARAAHHLLYDLIQEYPARFIGFAYASPLCGTMVRDVTEAIDQLGFRAIKIYPPAGDLLLTDACWHPLFEFANERGLTIITHTGVERSCEPKYLAPLAERFERVNFVAGHAGNVAPQRAQAIAAAKQYPNVYLETCSTFRCPGVIEQLVEEAGAHKVLYGSDLPLMDPRCQIGKIVTASIPEAARRLVLGENARRLLRL